jgi:1,4-dihydroxy-6-naphthoate synthase
MTKFTLGFSPCPNDTFIFDALVNKKIDTEGLDFEVVLEDVQTLNQWALQGKLDISKISYGVLPLVLDRYRLLDAGGALGKGVGPLLIAAREKVEVNNALIAIPGQHTTAHMLFSLAFPQARNKQFMLFSDIQDAVLSGRVDCGVIIHENRFTYQQKGLLKLMDLGILGGGNRLSYPARWHHPTQRIGSAIIRKNQPAY